MFALLADLFASRAAAPGLFQKDATRLIISSVLVEEVEEEKIAQRRVVVVLAAY
jgi:hypothetical protein